MNRKMTMPGDQVATAEEYMPGQDTYERDGKIFAAVMGRVMFNESDKTVSIVSVGKIRILGAGDIVLGEVGNVTNSLVSVTISGLENAASNAGAGETGVIHISKITASYTDDARKEYRTGDLVRAAVLQAAPSIQLTTREPELGVLKARCGHCRNILENSSGKLYCAECERFEHRKLASDFAKYTPEYRKPAGKS